LLSSTERRRFATFFFFDVRYWTKELVGRPPQGKTVDEQVDAALDRLLVEFGKEILKIIPGRVSTEVDARFSFDTEASVNKALRIIKVWSILVTVVWE
jgi:transaldolase